MQVTLVTLCRAGVSKDLLFLSLHFLGLTSRPASWGGLHTCMHRVWWATVRVVRHLLGYQHLTACQAGCWGFCMGESEWLFRGCSCTAMRHRLRAGKFSQKGRPACGAGNARPTYACMQGMCARTVVA
jgi:hypothetical protein